MANRIRWLRQPEYVHPPRRVLIVGAGGVGSWTALFLAIAGVQEITIVDGDIVEEHNLIRTPFMETFTGVKKVDALKTLINIIRPATTVNIADDYVINVDDISLAYESIVVDTTDSPELHIALEEKCRKLGIRFVRANYDFYPENRMFQTTNLFGHLGLDKKEWGEQEQQQGYRENRSYITPAVLSAIIAVDFILKMSSYPINKSFIKGYIYPNIFKEGIKVEKVI